MIENLQRNKDVDVYLEKSDILTQEVKEHLFKFKDEFKKLKVDELKFHDASKKIQYYYEFSKTQHEDIIAKILVFEDNQALLKRQIREFEENI